MSIEYIRGVQEQVDKNEIINFLKNSLADELNAVHNYWMQAEMVQGYLRDNINKELYQHREEEQGHANMIIDRILQLGGNPDIRPIDWDNLATCKYNSIIHRDQKIILEDALRGENCAVQHYTKLSQFTQNKDVTTYDMIMKILEDEYEHIADLKKLQDMLASKYEKENHGQVR
jgi:bacterioferritin